MKTRYTKTVLAGAIALTMCAGLSPPAFAYTVTHDFTLNDVQGGFDGTTYADDATILCETEACEVEEKLTGTKLHPIDSEFGFYVEDFVGAEQKERDGDYAEGYVGAIESGGIMVSNAATDKFKVKYPMGTWCAGLGGNSVKCSTEHYTVLEAVMTCNETVPYWYADDTSAGMVSDQAPLYIPGTEDEVEPPMTCANGALVDELFNVTDGVVDLLDPMVPDPTDPGTPDLVANESTVLYDIAVSPDYAMTKKDDGKPLYRFGNMIKRPNDIRLYANMALPPEWTAEGAPNFEVTKATLTIVHNITNNPNDQIRPEDMENEGAIGRRPQTTDSGNGLISARACYEGDGDPIPAGTVFRNGAAALGAAPPALPSWSAEKPYPYSDDLVNGYTNGWYTTIDRDPFANVDSTDVYEKDGVGDPGLIDNGGPRWRLKPNKFGQDIPGLEIPIVACSPLPFTHDNIRYEVGELTEVTINLLDWEEGEGGLIDSPLAKSYGWIDASQNVQNITETDPDVFKNTGPNGISINGVPMTKDFDLAVYIKGDRKATALYTATLDIEYVGEEPPPPPPEIDAAVVDVVVPASAAIGDTIQVGVTVENRGTTDIVRQVLALASLDTTNDWQVVGSQWSYFDLAAGDSQTIPFNVLVPAGAEPGDYTIRFWAGAYVTGDSVPDNDTTMDSDNVAVTDPSS